MNIQKSKKESNSDIEYAIFLDFDGTIISGDITDGGSAETQREGNAEYDGLSKVMFNNGYWNKHISEFRPTEGADPFKVYTKQFHDLMKKEGHYLGYEWSARFFTDFTNLNNLTGSLTKNDFTKMAKLRDQYFKETLNGFLFDSTVRIIKKLFEAGIKVYIISASPTFFVQGAQKFFNNYIPSNHAFGIDMSVYPSGARKDPITNFAEGKIQRIEKIVSDGLKNNKTIHVLAGFGNSWSTDGAFLRWIARKDGISVMINGGDVPDSNEDTKKIIRVEHYNLIPKGVKNITELRD